MKCTNCGADLSPLNIQCKIDRCEYCYEGWERKKSIEDRVKELEARLDRLEASLGVR